MSACEAEGRRSFGSVEGCLDACTQCTELVGALEEGRYGAAIPGNSPIGSHMRHCIDHFRALFRGLAAGVVDYDARDRDPSLESDAAVFGRAILDVRRELEALRTEHLDRPLQVLQMVAPGTPAMPVASTLGRELAFVCSHTIHHLALVKVLASMGGGRFPEHLGVAYSTRAYLQDKATHA